jgi:hypothetical protein
VTGKSCTKGKIGVLIGEEKAPLQTGILEKCVNQNIQYTMKLKSSGGRNTRVCKAVAGR